MYCAKCGNKITGNEKFCGQCGEPVFEANEAPPQVMYPQASGDASPTEQNTEPFDRDAYGDADQFDPGPYRDADIFDQNPYQDTDQFDPDGGYEAPPYRPAARRSVGSRKKPVILAVSAAVLAIAAFFVVTMLISSSLNKQHDSLVRSIQSCVIPSADKQCEDIDAQWEKASGWLLSEKKDLIKELEALASESTAAAEMLDTYGQTRLDWEADMEQYHLNDDFAAYETAVRSFGEAVDARDAGRARSAKENAEDALARLLEQNRSYINDRLAAYQSLNLSNAEDADIRSYNDNFGKLQSTAGSGDYNTIKALLTELDVVYSKYCQPERALSVVVQQVDVTDYPTVKLYVDCEDTSTGQVPGDLDQILFYVKKEDANGSFIKQTVTQVRQLNGLEALTIDVVADVSGSMKGSPLQEAKDVMSSFIRSVQFASGDTVELTAFSTGVRLVEPFSNDANTLISQISSLTTDNMTSLYDALCTAVTRVASQPGARCVIAFTDGLDNYSNSTAQDVIDLARRYGVPIFIIGIGSDIDYSVSTIASQTGGSYYSVNTISSMSDIYAEIYRQEKELYLIEFEDNTNASLTEVSNIMAGYHSPLYGGETVFRYTPTILRTVDASTIYTSGPEATVVGYLKNFYRAMTERNFSYISPYFQPGSNIYNMQESYVRTSTFTEHLDSYEIEDVTYTGSDRCIVTTRETYYIQSASKPLQLMTQRCRYVLELTNNEWKMTDFAESVKVLLRINA